MNRKLRNSLSAVTASAAALAIALMVAVPAGTSPVLDGLSRTSPSAIEAVALDHLERRANLAEAVALSAAAASALAFEAAKDMDAHPQSRASGKGTRHHRRQTIVMPYFSFSPRG